MTSSKKNDIQAETAPNPRFISLILGFSMLCIGICGISYEYTFSKLASDILGNSVRQWAVIIGLMMLFMGIGADAQKYFSDKFNVDNFILLEILLGLCGGVGPILILLSFGSFHEHFILVHYFFICAVGFMIGMEIPLLTRINHSIMPSLKRNLGLILKMDYSGSFLGALIWVFILPKFLNILEISLFLGIINVGVALFTWFWLRRWMSYPLVIPILGVGVLILLAAMLSRGGQILITAEQKLYMDPIIHTLTTPYQRIVLTESRSGDLYMYINGNLQFSSVDEHIYHEFLTHPAMAAVDKHEKILVLGGGDGLAVREILKYPEVKEVTLVDIDPEMTELAASFPELKALNQGSLSHEKTIVKPAAGVSRGELINLKLQGQGFFRRRKEVEDIQVHIMNMDAFKFANSISGIYDVIIIDFPDPNNENLSKLYSFEFYGLLKNRLAFGGLLIQQASSPVFAREAFLVAGRSMRTAGFSTVPIHHTVPSFGEWGWWIAGHQERFSEKSLKSKLKSVRRFPSDVRHITPELTAASLIFGKDALKSENADINTILKDRIFHYYRQAWKQFR